MLDCTHFGVKSLFDFSPQPLGLQKRSWHQIAANESGNNAKQKPHVKFESTPALRPESFFNYCNWERRQCASEKGYVVKISGATVEQVALH